tara:strand:- start:210 stop:893 length:684 start_codon:yes stop_codon:yes gene_type:complete
MKKILLSIIFYFLYYSFSLSHVQHYNDINFLEYDLYRNDNLIGSHTYNFNREGNNLAVKSKVNFKITKLGIDLYKYYAESVENYKNNKFDSFNSNTKQNKKDKFVNIEFDRKENKLKVKGSSYTGDADANYIVGTWWNHRIIEAKAQISAISGRIIDQKVIFIGKENININGRSYNSLHFKFLSSDENLPENKKLNTDIWYEENSYIWLKAKFVKQGEWEYRLKTIK